MLTVDGLTIAVWTCVHGGNKMGCRRFIELAWTTSQSRKLMLALVDVLERRERLKDGKPALFKDNKSSSQAVISGRDHDANS